MMPTIAVAKLNIVRPTCCGSKAGCSHLLAMGQATAEEHAPCGHCALALATAAGCSRSPPSRRCPAGWSGSPHSGPAAGGLRAGAGWQETSRFNGCNVDSKACLACPNSAPAAAMHRLTAGGCGVKIAHILAQHGGQVLVPHVVYLPYTCKQSAVGDGWRSATYCCGRNPPQLH